MTDPQEREDEARSQLLAAYDRLVPGIVGNRFAVQWPSAKQALFLSAHLTHREPKPFECLFGGAAGPGKSSALLLSAAQYVHDPEFHCIILRRTFAELSKPGAIMDRAMEWWKPRGAAWDGTTKTFRFPSGAKVVFGYLQHENDHLQYQGAEFHQANWDEMTQFPRESQYLYIGLSRVRRREGCTIPLRTLSTSNPGGPGHCIPYGEVLTEDGWKPIQEMAVGDRVLTVESDGSMSTEIVDQVHRSRATELVEVNARGMHLCMTPNHRVAKIGGVRGNPGGWSLVPFDQLPGQATILRSASWNGWPLDDFCVPQGGKSRGKQPKKLTGIQFVTLLGWVLSEGHAINRPTKRWVNIAQQKPGTRDKLAEFLTSCGFTYQVSKSGLTIHDCDWAEYFAKLGKSRDKYIPRWVLRADKQHLSALLDSLMDGDGHWETRGRSGVYYTMSRQLADDVCELLIKLGFIVHIHQRQRNNRLGLSYEVAFKVTNSGGTEILTGQHKYEVGTHTKRRSDIARHKVDQEVYCIGVRRTHNFIVRQRGCVWVSGNSWVKARFIGDPESGKKAPCLYIPARLSDNPHIDAGPYIAGLMHLHPTTRQQLLDGDWRAREPGDYFRRDWFGPLIPEQDRMPKGDSIRIRWWDLAASEKADAARTAGVLMARGRYGVRVIEHAVAFRATPGRRDDLIAQQAQLDGFDVTVGLEIEPGSGGQAQFETIRKRLRALGYRVVGARPSVLGKELSDTDKAYLSPSTHQMAGKAGRADPVASCLERGYRRRGESHDDTADGWGLDAGKPLLEQRDGIRLMAGPWTQMYLDEVEGFPDAATCDLVDATSGAWAHLEAHPMGATLPPAPPKSVVRTGHDVHPEMRTEDARPHSRHRPA